MAVHCRMVTPDAYQYIRRELSSRCDATVLARTQPRPWFLVGPFDPIQFNRVCVSSCADVHRCALRPQPRFSLSRLLFCGPHNLWLSTFFSLHRRQFFRSFFHASSPIANSCQDRPSSVVAPSTDQASASCPSRRRRSASRISSSPTAIRPRAMMAATAAVPRVRSMAVAGARRRPCSSHRSSPKRV